MRVRLGSRTSAQADPINFGKLPARTGGAPNRVTAIGFDFACQLDSPAAGITSMEILRQMGIVQVDAGVRQNSRVIARIRNGARIRDWYVSTMGKVSSPDPAAIGASLTNQIRRASLVIPCRANPNKFRWPKDFDIPAYALLEGGAITVNWNVTAGATEGLPAGSVVDSASVDVWVEYEPDTSGEQSTALPWTLNYIDTSVNDVSLSPKDLQYLTMLNHDRDHSDNTTVHIPGLVDNMTFQALAGAWNHQARDGDAMLTLLTPEFLPILYPQDYSKASDAPDNTPSLNLTRASSDAQILQYLVTEDVEMFEDEAAAAFGRNKADAKRKYGAKNAGAVQVTETRARKLARVIPVAFK